MILRARPSCMSLSAVHHPSLSCASPDALGTARNQRARYIAWLMAFVAALVFARPAQAQDPVNLQLTKGTLTSEIESGVPFEFILSYKCASISANCANTQLIDTLPPELEYITESATRNSHVQSVSFTADPSGVTGGTLTWNFVNPLPAGSTGILRFQAQFWPGTTPGTIAYNQATLRADNGQSVQSKQTRTIATGEFEMFARKTGNQAVVGFPTDYQLEICSPESQGGVRFLTPVITDTLPAEAHFVNAEGIQGTDWVYTPTVAPDQGGTLVFTNLPTVEVGGCLTRRVTLQFEEVPTPPVVNVMAATGTPEGCDPANYTANPWCEAKTTRALTDTLLLNIVAPYPGIGSDKSATSASAFDGSEAKPGEAITYTISARNTGYVTLTNVLVTDTLPVTATDLVAWQSGGAPTEPVTVSYQINNSTWIIASGSPYTSNTTITVAELGVGNGDVITRLRWQVGRLLPGQQVNFRIIAIVKPEFIPQPERQSFVNCARISNDTTGSTLNPCETTRIIADRAIPRITKELLDGNYLPLDTLAFTVTLTNDKVAHLPLVSPVIADLLPAEFTYVAGSAKFVSAESKTGAPEPTLTVLENYSGTQRTLLRWAWDGLPLAPDETLVVAYRAQIKDGTAPGAYPNLAALVDWTAPTDPDNPTNPTNIFLCTGSHVYTDTLDLDSDGLTSEVSCQDQVPARVGVSLAMESKKLTRGLLDCSTYGTAACEDEDYNTLGLTVPGGRIDYQVVMTNTSNVSITRISLVDIFPAVGDTGVVDVAARLSQWRPNLQNAVTGTTGIPLTVYYTTESNPCRADLASSGPAGCVDGAWTTTLPADPTSVRAIKIEMCEGDECLVLPRYSAIHFSWPMVAPNIAPESAACLTTLDNSFVPVDNPDCQIAWNSFGFTAYEYRPSAPEDALKLLPTEPIKVGMRVAPITSTTGFALGNLIWLDVAGQEFDGLQQSVEPSEWGVNGVRVELYDGEGALLDYRYTGPNNVGEAGYYLFTNLPAGDYRLRYYVPTDLVASLQEVGSDDTVDSDGVTTGTDPLYGNFYETPLIPLNLSTVDSAQQDLRWDFALWRPVDYGDAPWDGTNDFYPTRAMSLTNSADAARHVIIDGMNLGSAPDGELDGAPNSRAWGDDLTGAPDDEDGVRFATNVGSLAQPLAVMRPGVATTVSISGVKLVTLPLAYLQGWIDFNSDGDWDDTGEHVIVNQTVSSATFDQNFTVIVPANAALGTTYARFRYSSQPDLTPRAIAKDGEVEDYMVQIIAAPVKSLAASSESHTNGSDVTIGEIVRYRLAVQAPEGVLTNFVITDSLPSHLQFLNDGTVTVGLISNNGMTTTVAALDGIHGLRMEGSGVTTPTAHLPIGQISGGPFDNGTDPIFRLGDLANPDDDANAEYVVVEFNALVLNNSSNNNGSSLSNSFNVSYGTLAATSNTVQMTVREPTVQINKSLGALPSPLGPGGMVTYTIVISHATGSFVNAFDLIITDSVPSQLTNVQVVGVAAQGLPAPAALLSGNALRVPQTGAFDLKVGDRVTVTLNAQIGSNVIPNQIIDNRAYVQWSSLPLTGTLSNPTGSTTPTNSGTGTGERDGSATPAHNDYYTSDNAAFTLRGDWGDLPDSYGTLATNNGPRHNILHTGNPYLGSGVDVESDGQPNSSATGDGSDEDGVSFLTPFTPGTNAQVQVTTGSAGYLSAFIDLDGNGAWESLPVNGAGTISGGVVTVPGSGLATEMPISAAGLYTLSIPVPITATGNMPTRFRFTQNSGEGGASPTGVATSGEVEDYVLFSIGNTLWFDQGTTPANTYNGALNTGEPRVANATVQLLLDGTNTVIATTTTNASGLYRFHGVPAGNYQVLVAAANFGVGRPLEGYISTQPTEATPNNNVDSNDNGVDNSSPALNGIRSGTVTLSAGNAPSNESDDSGTFNTNTNLTLDFGFVRVDLGDAPSSYRTLLGGATPGPSHVVTNTFRLGAAIDDEVDGHPDSQALGDDHTGSDDEDGVIFEDSIITGTHAVGILVRGTTATLRVTGVKPAGISNAYLQGWIDFNRDGDFLDTGERVINNQLLNNTTASVNVAVPAGASLGTTFARFRYSSLNSGISANGVAPNGEVEDYIVQITGTPVKSVTSTSESHTSGNHVTIGEIVRYRLAVDVPEGVLTNFTITDTLPADLQFLNDGKVAVAFISNNDMTTTLPALDGVSGLRVNGNAIVAPTAILPATQITGGPFASGTDPVFALGTITNPDKDVANSEYVVIEFNVLVLNTVANQAGQTRDNIFAVSFGQYTESSNTLTVTLREPALTIDKQLVSLPTPVGPGATVQYDVVITNAVDANAITAFGVVMTDALSSEFVNGRIVSIASSGGVAGSITGTVSAGEVRVPGSGDLTIPVGGVLRVRIAAEIGSGVYVNEQIDNTAHVVWDTLPLTGTVSNPTGAVTPGAAGSVTGERNGIDGAGGALNDYRTSDTVTFGIGGDWGDLPAPYDNPDGNGQPRHRLLFSGNPALGAGVDSETGSRPSSTARGDDQNSSDDEDGVVFLTPLMPGTQAQVRVTTNRAGYLSAFMDFDADGTFDNVSVVGVSATPFSGVWQEMQLSDAGVYTMTISVPITATGNIPARFRYTLNAGDGGALPYGPAVSGEVEDYVLTSLGNQLWLDYGSGIAANNYNGLYDAGEAAVSSGVTLTLVLSGTETGVATTTTDAQGRYAFVGLTPGEYQVLVAAANFQTGGILDGYFSTATSEANANSNGDNNDNGTDNSLPALNGIRSSGFSLGLGEEPVDDGENTNPFDASSNQTLDLGFVRLDWGDAPASYGTLSTGNGARHAIVPGFGLGVVDYETNGQPDATATGDDLADSDDEDGVVFATPLVAGRNAAITVTATSAGVLNGWIDFNDNGLFEQVERVFADRALNAGANSLVVNVPNHATGIMASRFRLSAAGGEVSTPDGIAPNGEVEDYLLATLGNFVWRDANVNGRQDEGEPGINGVTVVLLDGTGAPVRDGDGNAVATTTANNPVDSAPGWYEFAGLLPGTYRVQFVLPTGELFTLTAAAETTANTDSDADRATGITPNITLALGDRNQDVDAGLLLPVTVGNRVWRDANGNGLQDDPTAEPGVEGVIATLLDSTTGLTVTVNGDPITTTTNAGGYYTFTHLYPGDYRVSFDLTTLPANFSPTYANQGADDGVDSDADSQGVTPATGFLASDGKDLTLDMGIVAPVSVGNRVWRDANGNGVQDAVESEPGVPEVGVALYVSATVTPGMSQDQLVITTTTDASGFYTFTNLPPGSYYVRFDLATLPVGFGPTLSDRGSDDTLDSDADATGQTPASGFLFADEKNMTLDMGIVSSVSIGNRVWYDANGDGLQGEPNALVGAEPGVENVVATLYEVNSGAPYLVAGLPYTVTTDANGTYTFTNLHPGNYYVLFDLATLPAGYAPTPADQGDDALDSDADATGATSASGFLYATGSNYTLDMGIVAPVTIGNRVWLDSNGDGVQGDALDAEGEEPGFPGITVTLYLSGTVTPLSATVTNASGYYTFTGQMPGDYTVAFDLASLPAGYVLTVADAGDNDAQDSDADESGHTGSTGFLYATQSNITLDMGIYQPVALGNRVWFDLNDNGVQDDPAQEPGVPNITVTLYDAMAGTPVLVDGLALTTTTDISGTYGFTELRPGQYYVVFDPATVPTEYVFAPANAGADDAADSDADSITGRSHTVTLPSGSSDLTLDAGLMPKRLQVTLTPQCIQDAPWLSFAVTPTNFTAPDNGVTLRWLAPDNSVIESWSNLPYQGQQLWPGAQVDGAGKGIVWPGWVLDNGVWVETPTDLRPAVTVEVQVNPTISMTVHYPPATPFCDAAPRAALGDRVWHDANGDGIQGDAVTEPGVPGVTVNLYDTSALTPTLIATSTTNARGYYSFTQLLAGSYQVRVVKPEAADSFTQRDVDNPANDVVDSDVDPTIGWTAPITLPVATVDSTWDAGLLCTSGAVKGILVAGEFASNVPLLLIPQGNTPGQALLQPTLADGSYHFATLPAGTYEVRVHDATLITKGYLPLASNLAVVTVQPCLTVEANFAYTTTVGALGDFVWYDVNANGLQDEWFDADGDGQITQNQIISGSALALANYEWYDINRDGRYNGPENEGELNKCGLEVKSTDLLTLYQGTDRTGATSSRPTGSTGYYYFHHLALGQPGWMVSLNGEDAGLEAAARATFATGLCKPQPGAPPAPEITAEITATNTMSDEVSATATADAYAYAREILCSITTALEDTVTLTAERPLYLDADFGIRCEEAVTVGDYVWYDNNGDGVQGLPTDEPGVAGVVVTLYRAATNMPHLVAGVPLTTTTNADGLYRFSSLPPANYYVVFDLTTLPAGYSPTFLNSNVDREVDSHVDENGQSENTGPMPGGSTELSLDMGISRIDLVLHKRATSNTIRAGGLLTYTLAYTNNGSLALDVYIEESVPHFTSFVATGSSAGWDCADGAVAGTSCRLQLGNLVSGVTGNITFVVRVDAALPDTVARIQNQATIGNSRGEQPSTMPDNNGVADVAVEYPIIPKTPTAAEPGVQPTHPIQLYIPRLYRAGETSGGDSTSPTGAPQASSPVESAPEVPGEMPEEVLEELLVQTYVPQVSN